MSKNHHIRALLKAILRSVIIICIGFPILFWIISIIPSLREAGYLTLLIPIAVIVLFVTVAMVVNEVFRIKYYDDNISLNHYSAKEMISLYGRSFIAVACCLSVAVSFHYYSLADNPEVGEKLLFYIPLFLLLIYALNGIVKGEKLREENYRRIQSENMLLKSQLNPHFLYNTLNNIDALIWLSPDKASEAILKLSSMMRYMTYRANHQLVAIQDEVKYITEFVELQKMRFDNPRLVSFQTNIKTPSELIAPMLLIPFVENAFKHATDKVENDAIRFYICCDRGKFIFSSSNQADESRKMQKDKEHGVGLRLVKKRLKLLYPGRYTLKTGIKGNQYEVYLEINIRQDNLQSGL